MRTPTETNPLSEAEMDQRVAAFTSELRVLCERYGVFLAAEGGGEHVVELTVKVDRNGTGIETARYYSGHPLAENPRWQSCACFPSEADEAEAHVGG